MQHEAHETHAHHQHEQKPGHEPAEHGHEHRGEREHQDGHEHHGGHRHHDGGMPASGWATAVRATLHCLTGCAIGEVLGMVIGTALGWGNTATLVLAIVLAFFFGYALTLRGVLKAGVGLRSAVRVALAADTLSIAVMELVDNAVIVLWPGAMDAGLGDALFWGALAIALGVAFVLTTPVNKWMIGRGRGHAVVHQYHH